jgi:hypothetical protein
MTLKRTTSLFGIIALVAVIGFFATACGGGGGGGGSLVGKWFDSESAAEKGSAWRDYPDFWFKSDGTFTYNMDMMSGTYTTDGDTITVVGYYGNSTETANYSISGNKLTFSALPGQSTPSFMSILKYDTTLYRGK